MVAAVRRGESIRSVARRFHVSHQNVSHWVQHAAGQRLDRVDFANRPRGRAWNRTTAAVERKVLKLRRTLREESVLGEYGADAIRAAMLARAPSAPARATIHRVLTRHGAIDHAIRIRRPPPPRGWYLPAVARGAAELDSFDWIEGLKIEDGPLVAALTAISLHGSCSDAWPQPQLGVHFVEAGLQQRWQAIGRPDFAQFDNDSCFQGAHQFPDTFGRITRYCLALQVTVVFAPPREPGFQNAIENFNGLWQAKVWQRVRVASLRELQAASDRYIRAHRQRNAVRREGAPPRRPFPAKFHFDPQQPLQGRVIFLRRTDAHGYAHLLGRRFATDALWSHRLVRCEVDLTTGQIACYALRRRAPEHQPQLSLHTYVVPDRPFQG